MNRLSKQFFEKGPQIITYFIRYIEQTYEFVTPAREGLEFLCPPASSMESAEPQLILQKTPEIFNLLYAQQYEGRAFVRPRPFFYQDLSRTFLVAPSEFVANMAEKNESTPIIGLKEEMLAEIRYLDRVSPDHLSWIQNALSSKSDLIEGSSAP